MNPFQPVSISFSPNTEPDDIKLAWKILFQPWRWQEGVEIEELEKKFKKYLGVKYAFSFNSGRSSLIAILNSLDIKEGDEIFLQAFTCNAAVNPILWQKAKPIFVDIDETLNLDLEDLKKKITRSKSSGQASKTRAVIIQHTFGYPAKIDEIKNICKKNNLFLIEDCAHSLGARYRGQLVGTFGDAAFFSFGRDKVISSVYGGMAITNNKRIAQRLKEFQNFLLLPSSTWIWQQILHPISFSILLPIYSFWNIGKGLLYLKQKLGILSPSVYLKEKKGEQPSYFPKRLPNAMAIFALNQFQKLEKFNKHRKEIANIYNRELSQIKTRIYTRKNTEPIYMHYPILIENASQVRRKLKRQSILLDDGWHSQVIIPPTTNLQKMNYTQGSCPRAEKIAKKILNLPTHINISEKEVKRILTPFKTNGN